MDGPADASVGCAFSQGIGNPMYYAMVHAFVTDYLFATEHPVFYRGWLENELIKYSVAYRTLTGKQYVPNSVILDQTSDETMQARRAIIPTKVGASRDILAFYLKAERAMLRSFPKARYIFSTEPVVNQFTGDFEDIYASPSGSIAHANAMAKRDVELKAYLDHYQNDACTQATYAPSYTYIFVEGAIRLERWIDEERRQGRGVAYYNLGVLMPDARNDRIPYFIDPAHLSDKGDDLIGRFYAQKILAAEE